MKGAIERLKRLQQRVLTDATPQEIEAEIEEVIALLSDSKKKYARKCDATGRGIEEGYVFGDGEMYFSEEEYLVKHLRSRGGMDGLSDEFILNEAYNLGEYYWTQWEDTDEEIESQGYYYDEDGNEYEVE